MSAPDPVWIDGEIRARADARIGVDDRGFLLGHAAFETMRISEGALRRWDRHHARLLGGLAYLGIAPPACLDGVEAGALHLASGLGVKDGVARLTVSAGEGGAGLDGAPDAQALAVLTVKPRPAPPQSVSVTVLDAPRRSGSPGERFKLSGYADLIAARREARAAGFDRAVVTCAAGGVLACADCATLYWIIERRIQTPSLSGGALPGVARAALMAAARADGLEIEEVSATPDVLRGAEAAFMTNAVEGVVAISRVGDRPLDPGHPLLARARALEAGAS